MFKLALHDGVFRAVIFESEPTLQQVIKAVNWGSNRDIREKGFRIDENFNFECPYFSCNIKAMPKIKDPNRIIKHGQAILTNKGNHVLVVKVI